MEIRYGHLDEQDRERRRLADEEARLSRWWALAIAAFWPTLFVVVGAFVVYVRSCGRS